GTDSVDSDGKSKRRYQDERNDRGRRSRVDTDADHAARSGSARLFAAHDHLGCSLETFVMNSVKELLQQMIERMSDVEARQLLEFGEHLQHRRDDSLTLTRLAADPAFKVPGSGARDFHSVAPIHGKGLAASRLLVDDRR